MKYRHDTDFFGEFQFVCSSLAEFKLEVEDIVSSHDHIKMPDLIEVCGDKIIGWYNGYKEVIGSYGGHKKMRKNWPFFIEEEFLCGDIIGTWTIHSKVENNVIRLPIQWTELDAEMIKESMNLAFKKGVLYEKNQDLSSVP